MKNFNTIVEDIHDYLSGAMAKEDFSVESTSAANVIDLAKGMATHTLDLLDHKPREARDPTISTVRMSEIGTPCLRQLWFKWFKPEYGLPPFAESGHPTMPLKFLYGDYLEELVLFLAKEAGHSVVHRQKEVLYVGDITAIGHIDAMIDGVVVDVKSSADVSFQKYKREGLTEENDTFGYRYQLDAYAKAIGTTCRAFIFINKHDGEILVIDRTSEPPVDVDLRLKKIKGISNNPVTLPPRYFGSVLDKPGYGNKLPTVCSYCAFKYTCYDNDITGYVISGRPVYYTELTEKGRKYVKDKAKIPPPQAYQSRETVEIRGKGGSVVEDDGIPF